MNSNLNDLEGMLKLGAEHQKIRALYSDNNERLRFERWLKKASIEPQRQLSLVGKLMWWRTNVDCYRSEKHAKTADSRENLVARELGFIDGSQRERYNAYCRSMGITIHSNRKKYLSGIEDWKRNIEGTGFIGISSIYGTRRDYSSFREWYERNSIRLSEENTKAYVDTYKRVSKAKRKMKDLMWSDRKELTRYTNYCYSVGFRPYMDPIRYVEGIEYWRKVIDTKS